MWVLARSGASFMQTDLSRVFLFLEEVNAITKGTKKRRSLTTQPTAAKRGKTAYPARAKIRQECGRGDFTIEVLFAILSVRSVTLKQLCGF